MLRMIKGTRLRSLAYAMCSDLDIAGTYPTLQYILNISKETTHRELVTLVGPETESHHGRRWYGIDVSSACANAQEIGYKVHQLPTSQDLLAAFLEEEAA